MNIRLIIRIFTLSLLFVSAATEAAEAASVRLSVQLPRGKRTINTGETFYISYEISDVTGEPQRPQNVPGASVLYFDKTGQSSRFSSVNGHTSQSFTYTYTLTLRAKAEGSYKFGPVTVGGVKSNVVSYSIGKNDTGNSRGSGQANGNGAAASGKDSSAPEYIGKGNGNLFLRANVSKATAYEQEALVYTVKLFTTYDAIKFIGATSAPKFDGFVVEESSDISRSLSYENYQGKTYATAVIARYIIFPQMSGKLKVTGNTYTVSVDEREYYHDPFWGSMSVGTPKQLNVTPNDLTVDVKPLPRPQPSDFSGGVGQFSLQSSLPRQTFLSNQAASVIYSVKGSGNIKYIKLPDLNTLYPSQLEVYSPNTDVKVNVGTSNVSGNVRFDYSFMPLEEGHFKIPEVTLVYFNPSTGKYERSTANGFSIDVGKGKASDKSQRRSKAVFIPELAKDCGKPSITHRPVIKGFAYWLMYIIPVIALGAGAAGYSHYRKLHADEAALRSRRANSFARRRLRRAADAMRKNDAKRFNKEMLKALWGYLGDKLKMPTSELTRDNVEDRLKSKGLGDAQIGSFIKLLDDIEFASYAHSEESLPMQNIYDDAQKVINSFEEGFRSIQRQKKLKSEENDSYDF